MTKPTNSPTLRVLLTAEARRAARASRTATAILSQMNLRSRGGRRP
jgi:hypothetical protein